MTIEHKTVLALKWNAAAKLTGQLVSWLVTLIVLRILAPSDYGLMAIVMVILTIVGSIAEFGIGAALVQAPELARQEISRIAGALGLLNLTCGTAIALSAPWLAAWFGEPDLIPLIQVAAVQFLFSAIEVVPLSLLQRELDFKRIARNEIAGALVASLGTLLLAVSGMGVWALLLGWLAGGAIRAGLFAASGHFVTPQLRFQSIGRHIHFAGTITATRIIWQLTQQMDALIAGRFLGREILGLYSVAMNLATLPMSKLMGVVNQVAFSAVSRLQGDQERLRTRLLESLRLLSLVSIPCLWGLASVAPEFVDALLGRKWKSAVIALQLVSLVAPARMFMAILSTALAGIGRAGVELRNTIVGAFVLAACLLVGVQWQLVGLAASWVVAVPLVAATCLPRTMRALGLQLREIANAVRVPVLGGCAMYVAVTVARQLLPELHSAWLLILLILTGSVTYVGTVLLLDKSIVADLKRIAAALRQQASPSPTLEDQGTR